MFRGFFLLFSPPLLGARCIVARAPLVLADYKEDDCVLCASPIFMLVANYLGFTNRKRKYFEEKMTPTLKSKQVMDRHGPKPSSNTSQLPDLPHFSLVTTFKCY
jgi:hypothetical protein